jgi:hypothetical protein
LHLRLPEVSASCTAFDKSIEALAVSIRPHTSTSAYVRIRQHTSAYVRQEHRGPCCQHTSAYVYDSIRQLTSAYVSIRQHKFDKSIEALAVSTRQHTSTSAYVRIRQHTSAYVRQEHRGPCCQHTSAYIFVSIRPHTSAYVRIRSTRASRPLLQTQRLLRQYLYFCTSKASKLSVPTSAAASAGSGRALRMAAA